MNNYKIILTIGLCTSLIISCKKKATDPITEAKNYSVPTTYEDFDNVDYSGQTIRLDMLKELTDTMKKGNTIGVRVSATRLKNMYANTGNPFGNNTLNTSGKKMKDKTFPADQAMFESYMDSIAMVSMSNTAGSNGVPGVVGTGSTKYLCNKDGIEYTQLIEKGLLGAMIYYQITSVYLSEDKIGPQVSKADRQHHWDEAFGYFGVPKDFPSNTSGIRFIGKYCNDRNPLLGCNEKIMNAYLKGRAAINNDDDVTRRAQVAIIRDELERVIAATALQYLNKAKANITDNAVRNHALSEYLAFLRALKYNPTRKITDAQISEIENYVGYNFYNVTTSGLDNARNKLSSIYGFDNIKDQLRVDITD
ncbi:MAG: DUF4856 domain-containing protein [Cytophagaceae bacterium]|nr:DUF4856 domain-containing protein [Cytophagaceae bacterium]MDW8456418.1 DUF4856 domain-containing protein [Cytophagaceae bacterium]